MSLSFPYPSNELIYRLGWMLIHTLWLGTVTAALFAVAMAALRRRSARLRYVVGCVALVAFMASAVAAFVLSTPPAQPAALVAAKVAPALPDSDGAPDAEVAPHSPLTAMPVRPAHINLEHASAPTHAMPIQAAAATPDNKTAAPVVKQEPPFLARAAQTLEPALPWLVLAWTVGVCILALWQLTGWIAAQRLKRLSVRSADADLVALVGRLADRLGVRRAVKLLESALVRVPTVIGWLRPVILLPLGFATGLTPAQVESILVHELSHIRRYDYLVNLLQSLVETLLFYHPATWYISRRIRTEREHCCDDLTLAFGVNQRSYAQSLLHLAQHSKALDRTGLAPAGIMATGKPSELRSRVGRVLGAKDETSRVARSWLIAAASVLLAVVPLLVLSCTGDGPNPAAGGKSDQPATQPALAGGQLTVGSTAVSVAYASPWRVKLPSGVSVELVALAKNPPKNIQWWRPDGAAMDKAPAGFPSPASTGVDVGDPMVAFAVQVSNQPADSDVEKDAALRVSVGNESKTLEGDFLALPTDSRGGAKQILFYCFDLKPEVAEVGIPVGPWKTAIDGISPRGSTKLAQGGSPTFEAIFGDPYEKDISFGKLFKETCVFVTVSHTLPLGLRTRVTAVLNDGKEITCLTDADCVAALLRGISSRGLSSGTLEQGTWGFRGVRIKDIRAFRLQLRPFEWATFKNFASQPGRSPATQPVVELKYLAMQPEDTSLEPASYWRPDGQIVTDDQELAKVRRLPVCKESGQGVCYHLWFLFPTADQNSWVKTRFVDDNGSPISGYNGVSASRSGDSPGWIGITVSAGKQVKAPAKTNVLVEYAIGEWKSLGTATPDMSEQIKCGPLTVLGLTSDTSAKGTNVPQDGVAKLMYSLAVDQEEGIQFIAEALTRDGRRVLSASHTKWVENGVIKGGEAFNVALKDIKEIVIKSRPTRTIIFSNVSLKAGEMTKPRTSDAAGTQPATQPTVNDDESFLEDAASKLTKAVGGQWKLSDKPRDRGPRLLGNFSDFSKQNPEQLVYQVWPHPWSDEGRKTWNSGSASVAYFAIASNDQCTLLVTGRDNKEISSKIINTLRLQRLQANSRPATQPAAGSPGRGTPVSLTGKLAQLAGADSPSPEQAIVIDPMSFSGIIQEAIQNNVVASLDEKDGHPLYGVYEPGKRNPWGIHLVPLDLGNYPIAVMTYRAKNLPPTGQPIVVLTNFFANQDAVVFSSQDLQLDGQLHQAVCDTRTVPYARNPSSGYVAVPCGEKAPATLELVGLRFLTADAAATAKVTDDKPIEVQVLDAQNQPLEGATVTVDAQLSNWGRSAKTDKNGRATVTPLVTPQGQHMLRITKDGFATAEAWGSREDPKSLPSQVRLAKAVRYGGVVQDENGQPIAGACINTHLRGSTGMVRWMPEQFTVVTDAKGRWQSPPMALTDQAMWMRLGHPDYIRDTYYSSTSPLEKLKDHTSVMVLKRGITIAGVVVDSAGKPVAGAEVKQGRDRYGTSFPSVWTDKDGRFAFKNCPPADMVLTVQRGGFGPDMKELRASKDITDLRFVLPPGQTIQGVVVDREGHPVPGVNVTADTWRGCRALEWWGATDAQGKFKWTDAPSDGVLFNLFVQGYMSDRRQTLKPSDTPYKITMLRPLKISGTVVDDQGKPVESFKIFKGLAWQDGRPPSWERRDAMQGKGGKFEVTTSEQYPAHFIRIEADGFKPAISRAIKDEEENVKLDFKLTRGTLLTGAVTLEGKAVPGASVALMLPGQGAYIRNGREIERRDLAVVECDAQGKFSFPGPAEKWKLIALAEGGYGEFSDKEYKAGSAVDLKLQPWARIEGTLMIGSKAGAGQQIAVNVDRPYIEDEPSAYHDIKTTTDKEGHFAFDRVPPGKVSVARVIQLSERMTSSQQAVKVDAKAGQTVQVKVGGMGRPIVGRIVIPPELKDVGLTYANSNLRTNVEYPKAPSRPSDLATKTPEEQRKWYEEYKKTAAYKEYQAAMTKVQEKVKYFPFALATDGSFRIDDVPAGPYKLDVTINDPPTQGCGYGDPRGAARTDVTVPEMPGGRSDEPLDIGEIHIGVAKVTKVGTQAPDFAASGLNGKTIKLSDYRGKYVLLDFWATWCGPCRAESPHLQAVYDAFKGESNFVMIGLDLDEDIKTVKEYVQKQSMPWTQVFLGDWNKTKLPDEYGVRGIPSIFLIDPDGKIVAKDLRGPAIAEAVAKALGKPVPATPSAKPTYPTTAPASAPATQAATQRATAQATQPATQPAFALESGAAGDASRQQPASEAWRQRFDKAYSLTNRQMLRRIAPPFLPERYDYYRNEEAGQWRVTKRAPDYFVFEWEAGELRSEGYGFTDNTTLAAVLQHTVRLGRQDFVGPREILDLNLPGDWVYRKGASQGQLLADLESIIKTDLGRDIRFTRQLVERDVVVVKGKYVFTPQTGSRSADGVHIYAQTLDPIEGSGGGTGSVSQFLQWVGSRLNVTIIDQTDPLAENVSWYDNKDSSFRSMGDRREELTNKTLANLSRQTGLTFTRHRDKGLIWVVSEAKDASSQPAPASAPARSVLSTTAPATQPATQPALLPKADLDGLCGEVTLTLGWNGQKVKIPGPLVWPAEGRKKADYKLWQVLHDIRTLKFTDSAGRRWQTSPLGPNMPHITVHRPDGTLLATGQVCDDSGPSNWEFYDASGKKQVLKVICREERDKKANPTGRWGIVQASFFDPDGTERRWELYPSGLADVVRWETVVLPSAHIYDSANAGPYSVPDKRYSPELDAAVQRCNARFVAIGILDCARQGQQDVVDRLVLPGSKLAQRQSDLPAMLKGEKFSVPQDKVTIDGDKAKVVASRKNGSATESVTLRLVQNNGYWLVADMEIPNASAVTQPASQPTTQPVARKGRVGLEGAFVRPGAYDMPHGTVTLRDAIALAGGALRGVAQRYVYVIPGAADSWYKTNPTAMAISPKVVVVDLKKAEAGDPKENIQIHPNDLVMVLVAPERNFCVMGAVARPGWYTMTGQYHVTVKTALAASGMVGKEWPAKGTLIRQSEQGISVELQLNLRKIVAGEVKDVFLQANDVLLVTGDGASSDSTSSPASQPTAQRGTATQPATLLAIRPAQRR